MKNVLITGGNGFIGSNFINYMVNKYQDVNFYNYDCNYYCSSYKNTINLINKPNYKIFNRRLQDKKFLSELLNLYSIDTIIHFAAQSHVDTSFHNSLLYTDDNIYATHILLECIREYNKIELFIHISTDEVYGENINDNDIKTELTTLCPTNPYAATKAAAEMIINSYYYSFKIPIIIIRSNNIYGKHQYIEKVIPKFITRILNNEKITIQGDGTNKRSFLYIDDFIKGLEIVLLKGEIGNIYNIGSTDEISIMDLGVKLLKLIHNYNDDYIETNLINHIEYIKDRNFNDKRYNICDNKIKKLGWNKSYSLDDGLKETIEWYKNNSNYWEDK
jgi:dTDP-glucose 4,6-dehydratase